jgi:hypothetical protein
MRDLSLHLLDIVQNSLAARADKIRISVSAIMTEDEMKVIVEDNGTGMDRGLLEDVTNPFTTTRLTRRTGMGLALLKESAQRTGGYLEVASELGKGTFVKAVFKISNIDRIPLGDLGDTMSVLIAMDPEIRYVLELDSLKGRFILDTEIVKEKLADVPLYDYNVVAWLKEYVNENIIEIFGGVLNEVTG